MQDLFNKVAKEFDLKMEDILFCTLNTFKPDMSKLFTGCMGCHDLLFVHVRGQAYEVDIYKDQSVLGVTLGDNGLRRSFVKHITKNGTIDKHYSNIVFPGQLIEKINGVQVIGLRHYEVAKMLKDIPMGTTCTLRLVSPIKYEMGIFHPRTTQKTTVVPPLNGFQTIRIQPKGGFVLENAGENDDWIAKINTHLENYLGIHDDQLAHSLLEIAKQCQTSDDFMMKTQESDLKDFGFPSSFVDGVWSDYMESKAPAIA